MKIYKVVKTVCSWGTFLCLCICFILMVGKVSDTAIQQEIYVLDLENEGIDIEIARNIQRSEMSETKSANFTFWSQTDACIIENKELYRQESAVLILACGDTQVLFPDQRNIIAEDFQGCLLSENIAYALFGDKSVVGQKIEYNDSQYEVYDTIPKTENIVVIQANPQNNIQLKELSVLINDGNSVVDSIENIKNKYGLQGIRRKILSYYALSKIFVFLFLVIMTLIAVLPFLKMIVNYRKDASRFVPIFIVLLIVLVVFFILIKPYMYLPRDISPDKWSNFDFWLEYAKSKEEKILWFLTESKLVIEISAINVFFAMLGYGIVTMILFVIFLKNLRVGQLGSLYMYVVVSLFCSFLSITKFEIAARGNNLIWFFIILSLGCRFLVLDFVQRLNKLLRRKKKLENG